MASKDLENQIKHILAHVPGCCRENALMAMADDLRQTGRKAEANELVSMVDKLLKVKQQEQRRASSGPPSKYVKGAPASLDRYYESCVKKYHDRPDVNEHCREVSRRILCANISPSHPFCRS